MSPVKIIYAEIKDVQLIKNLSWQTFFDTFHAHNTRENMEMFLSKNFTEETVRSDMRNAKNTFIVAYIKKQPVGYAKLSEMNQPADLCNLKHIEISRIYATKEKIGSGIGKALMSECIEVGRKKDKKVIWLGVWEHNQKAIQFYRRWGFEKFSEQIFMLGNDRQNDWLMKKEISE